MKEVAKIIAFILLIVGTIGLLLNEFVSGWGRSATITFACLNFVGLIALAYTSWVTGKRKGS
jgi:membrane-bound ClpP family serine protease